MRRCRDEACNPSGCFFWFFLCGTRKRAFERKCVDAGWLRPWSVGVHVALILNAASYCASKQVGRIKVPPPAPRHWWIGAGICVHCSLLSLSSFYKMWKQSRERRSFFYPFNLTSLIFTLHIPNSSLWYLKWSFSIEMNGISINPFRFLPQNRFCIMISCFTWMLIVLLLMAYVSRPLGGSVIHTYCM